MDRAPEQLTQLLNARAQVTHMPLRNYCRWSMNNCGTCVHRLAERVLAGLGSEMDHDLLARFLTRDVRLNGRLVQVIDHPALSFSAWEGAGFPVEGVAAVLPPLAALDGTEARLDGGDIYISGGRASGAKAGVSESIRSRLSPRLRRHDFGFGLPKSWPCPPKTWNTSYGFLS